MLELSFATVVILSLLSVGAIVATHFLKSVQFLKESYWNIPAACFMVSGVMLVYELFSGTPFEVKDGVVIILAGLLAGCAAGGLYKMIQGFQGKK